MGKILKKKAILYISAHPKENYVVCSVGKNCRIYAYSETEFTLKCDFQTTFDESRDAEQRLALFSPNGKLLLTGGTDGLRLWTPADDFSSVHDLGKVNLFEHSIKSFHWWSDSVHVVVISNKIGKVLKLEGTSEFTEVFQIKPKTAQHEYRVCRFAPSGHFFTSQDIKGKEASITKYGLHTKKEIGTKKFLPVSITPLSILARAAVILQWVL